MFPTKRFLRCSLSGLTLVLAFTLRAEFPYLRSIIKIGGSGNQAAIAAGAGLDSITNVYVLGSFETALSVGTDSFTNTAGFPNLFLTRFSLTGSPISVPAPVWTRVPGIDAPLQDLRFGVHFSGGAVIAGSFAGTNISFDSSRITNTSPGTSEVFIGKFDPTGASLWLQSFGGSADDRCGDLVVDAAGNNYLAGSFVSDSFTVGTTNLTRQGSTNSDAFFIKTDASGNVLWVRQGTYAAAKNLAVDSANNSYLAGSASGASVFDGLTPTNPTTGQFFIKYNSAGTPLWCRGDMKIGSKMVVDRPQNIISAGTYAGQAQWGSTTLTSTGPASVFIAKYDSAGNTLWARPIPGLGNDQVTGMFIDGFTNYWVTGSFGSSDGNATTNGRAFVACFDSAGNTVGVGRSIGSGFSAGNCLGTVQGGINFLCGTFSDQLNLGGNTLTNGADTEIFLTRLAPAPPTMKSTRNGGNVIHSWPNPTALGFAASEAFTYETSTDLSAWSASTNTPKLVSGQYQVTNAISAGPTFHRLRK